MPWSAALTADWRKPMFPATTVAVSTERIMATAAMVMATSTISAMNSVTPRWRRRLGGLLWAYRFMSARFPDPVAQRHGRLEHPVAVALPGHAGRQRNGRQVERSGGPCISRPGWKCRCRIAGRAQPGRRFLRLRAARHHGDPHGDDLRPVRRRGDEAIDHAVVRGVDRVVGDRTVVDAVIHAVIGA